MLTMYNEFLKKIINECLINEDKEAALKYLETNKILFDKSEVLKNEIDNELDANKGQIKKAIINWYKWGQHYLKSLQLAHEYQICTNFKDDSLQKYIKKDTLFNEYIIKGEDIFINIPPPKPSCENNNTRHRGIDLTSSISRSGVCFSRYTLIKCNDGSFKPIKELKKNDLLFKGYKVLCLIKYM